MTTASDIRPCAKCTPEHDLGSPLHRMRVQVEAQMPYLGTSDPVIVLSGDLFDAYMALSDAARKVVRRWLCAQAIDRGHYFEPRLQRGDAP